MRTLRRGWPAVAIAAGLLACSQPTDPVARVRAAPARSFDTALPEGSLEQWVTALMHPTEPEWSRVPCEAGPCVEARARHANALEFGIAVRAAPGHHEIVDLFLEVEGRRRHFEAVDAWAIAVATLAPRS